MGIAVPAVPICIFENILSDSSCNFLNLWYNRQNWVILSV